MPDLLCHRSCRSSLLSPSVIPHSHPLSRISGPLSSGPAATRKPSPQSFSSPSSSSSREAIGKERGGERKPLESMEGGQTSGSSTGPAPFLLKTYDMVEDPMTDAIVSWSSTKASFVVWNPPEFSRVLLPTYFKHNNFSSFIRQLNTYGFHKIDSERWEFANDDFVKDQKHLLKNIHRRKPIHSHSQPQASLSNAERSALEEEIERLLHEKAELQVDLSRYEQWESSAKGQLDDLERRVHDMEQRQKMMMEFLAQAINNPCFVKHLIRMAEASADISSLSKKRRVPDIAECSQEFEENSFVDNQSNTSKPDSCLVFQQDFLHKLRLELSPAVSNSHLVSDSLQGSTEESRSSLKNLPNNVSKDLSMRTEHNSFVPETLELSDTGTSFAPKNISPSMQQRNENAETNGFIHCVASADGDGYVSCQLNLSLASSTPQANSSQHFGTIPHSLELEIGSSAAELRFNPCGREPDVGVSSKNCHFTDESYAKNPSPHAPINNQMQSAPQGRVNDVFWEQFLTERPGSSDNEEASSNFRVIQSHDQDGQVGNRGSSKSMKDLEQLTL